MEKNIEYTNKEWKWYIQLSKNIPISPFIYIATYGVTEKNLLNLYFTFEEAYNYINNSILGIYFDDSNYKIVYDSDNYDTEIITEINAFDCSAEYNREVVIWNKKEDFYFPINFTIKIKRIFIRPDNKFISINEKNIDNIKENLDKENWVDYVFSNLEVIEPSKNIL